MTAITLSRPIQRDDKPLDVLELRKPNAGELRGLSLQQLLQMDITSILRLLPRITAPAISPEEAAGLDPVDLTSLGVAIVGFFATTETLAKMEAELPAS